jgi:hypothetical protein
MFTIDSLRRREAQLAIATLAALLLALVPLFTVSARPAHACLVLVNPGQNAFSAAPPLSVGPNSCTGSTVSTAGNTSGATMEVGEPRPYSSTNDCGIYGISNSVWWKVTVPSNLYSSYYGSTGGAYLKLTTENSSFDTVLAVYKGSSLTSLQQVACSNNNSLPNWTDKLYAPGLPKGQTYYVQLSGTGGARSGAYSLNAAWITPTQYVRETRL